MVCVVCSAARLSTPAPSEPLPHLSDSANQLLDHIEPNNRDGSNDDCWNRALSCADCNGEKRNLLTPEKTIDKAKEDGRISTLALKDEQIEAFERRHQWAKKRWERIKP